MSTPPDAPEASADSVDEVAAAVPLLGMLAREVTAGGLTFPTSDAVLGAGLDPRVLEPFLLALVDRARPDGVLGLALLGMELVDRSGSGPAATEAALARLTADCSTASHAPLAITGVARRLRNPSAVRWWHGVQPRLRQDSYYYHFLRAHTAVLLPDLHDDVAAYLLDPDRGPAHLNLDAIELAIRATDRPQPFVARWVDWLQHRRAAARHLVAMLERRVPFADLVRGVLAGCSGGPPGDLLGRVQPLVAQGLYLLERAAAGNETAERDLTDVLARAQSPVVSRAP